MAFSDYKRIADVQKEFKIKYREERFLAAQPVEPPAQFLTEFKFSNDYFDLFASEGARSELIISPILREVFKSYAEQCALWIQEPLCYRDPLKGTPDYLVAKRSPLGKTVMDTPLLIVIEAKRNDFEQGWGQCLAEMVAAQNLNGDPHLPLYGIVTDGFRWEVGKLAVDIYTRNKATYDLDDFAALFGALHYVFQAAVANIDSVKESFMSPRDALKQ